MSFNTLSSIGPASTLLSTSTGSTAPAAGNSPLLNDDHTIRVERARVYPHQLWWLIASFIAFITLCQLVAWLLSSLSSRRAHERRSLDSEAGKPSTRRSSWTRLPTSLVNFYRVVAFRWTVEVGQSYTLNFAEVFVTCAYIVALFTWEFANTTNLEGQRFDPNYWGNRAGVLAASQFPLITALGTKNNIIAYITGISYDKLNYVHRISARVVFVLLWVHGGGKLAYLSTIPDGFSETFVRLGLTALLAFTLLIIVSLRPIRSQVYEIFYFTHFFMVLVLLLGAYFHANTFHQGAYIWPAFLIWALDRFIRIVRVVYYNHLYFGFSSKANRLDASVELLSPHFVRLHLHRPPHFNWTPGQTAFLIMPTVSGFPLETHPFTIASVDAHYQLAGVKSPASGEIESKFCDTDDVAPFWKELVFLINVREGFTKRLAEIAQRGQKVKVLVDGPYGFSPNLDKDDTVVLIAGGSGVSFTLSTFLGVLSNVQKGKSRCRKLMFVWAIRDASHIEWVSKALTTALEFAPQDIEISIRFYVTSKTRVNENTNTVPLNHARPWDEDDSIHLSEGTAVGQSRPPSLFAYPSVQVIPGRPNLHSLLGEEIDANTGRLSVSVCGSQAIARTCRKALRIPMSTVINGGPSVVLHVESFGYA